jgi:SAM-dependent methyltransferase
MTTLPPELSPTELHRARQMAESFGTDAERYDRTRPRYPQALIDRIVAACPGRDVLDVGIGTGVAARPFRAAGCNVLGIDPDARMAEFARRDGFEVEVAKIEDWNPAGRTFDAVIAGQAWHWVDPVAGAAKAAQVLRPGGRLAVFWNTFNFPQPISEALADLYQRVLPDSPLFRGMTVRGVAAYAGQLTKAADGMKQAGGFGEAEQWQVDWDQSYTTDQWLDMVPTTGGFSQIPAGKQDQLLAGIRSAIDAQGGSFLMGYASVAVTAARNESG